ncbi:hypothetical protein [Nonomuraea aridisoli]|uniref:hypothetical protein n=1 Tax=Nonomuraea aridisoli TaxID=2070368 RepID=UPI0011B94924|nr:hypothetical protein [Nonomuraea aridisoli]
MKGFSAYERTPESSVVVAAGVSAVDAAVGDVPGTPPTDGAGVDSLADGVGGGVAARAGAVLSISATNAVRTAIDRFNLSFAITSSHPDFAAPRRRGPRFRGSDALNVIRADSSPWRENYLTSLTKCGP